MSPADDRIDRDRADLEASEYRFRLQLAEHAIDMNLSVKELREACDEGITSPLFQALFEDDQSRRYDNLDDQHYRPLTDILKATYIKVARIPHVPMADTKMALLPKDDVVGLFKRDLSALPDGAEPDEHGYRFNGGEKDALKGCFKALSSLPNAIDVMDDEPSVFEKLVRHVSIHKLGAQLGEIRTSTAGDHDTISVYGAPEVAKALDEAVEAQTQDLETDLAR